jgi:hypothetical protein
VAGSANLKTEPTEQRGRLEMDHAPPHDNNGLIWTEISIWPQMGGIFGRPGVSG